MAINREARAKNDVIALAQIKTLRDIYRHRLHVDIKNRNTDIQNTGIIHDKIMRLVDILEMLVRHDIAADEIGIDEAQELYSECSIDFFSDEEWADNRDYERETKMKA